MIHPAAALESGGKSGESWCVSGAMTEGVMRLRHSWGNVMLGEGEWNGDAMIHFISCFPHCN
jgi:hypothetical protein